eukprot:11413206-Alexandrium_andersonii.AAC.2
MLQLPLRRGPCERQADDGLVHHDVLHARGNCRSDQDAAAPLLAVAVSPVARELELGASLTKLLEQDEIRP